MSINAVAHTLSIGPPPSAATLLGTQRSREDSPSVTAEPAASGARVVFNPRSHFDASAGVFVMEYRNADTGEVERQFPDENQLRAYANAKRLEAEPAAETTVPDAPAPAAAPPQGGATAPSPVRIQV